jgi:Cdc6-like AAA superfamily ATPase
MEYLHTNEDGSTVKYTEEMIKNTITDRSYYQDRYYTSIRSVGDIKAKVYEFFKDRYDTGDTEITCTVDDVNELLESIGADKLKALFTVNGTISFSIVDVEADSEEDARDIVSNDLNLEFNGDGSLDEWDVDVTDASQQ